MKNVTCTEYVPHQSAFLKQVQKRALLIEHDNSNTIIVNDDGLKTSTTTSSTSMSPTTTPSTTTTSTTTMSSTTTSTTTRLVSQLVFNQGYIQLYSDQMAP